MVTIYVRKFALNNYEKSSTNQYSPSRYFPEPMSTGLKIALSNKGYIREEDYIIGPLYNRNEFQIGMSGTVEKKESFYNAIAREMGEEIGIIPKNNTALNLIKEFDFERKNKQIKFNVYDGYIKDCIPVLEHQHDANVSKESDSFDKVGCYIYGMKKDILTFLSGPIYHYKTTDNIIGLVAVRAGDIFQL